MDVNGIAAQALKQLKAAQPLLNAGATYSLLAKAAWAQYKAKQTLTPDSVIAAITPQFQTALQPATTTATPVVQEVIRQALQDAKTEYAQFEMSSLNIAIQRHAWKLAQSGHQPFNATEVICTLDVTQLIPKPLAKAPFYDLTPATL